MLTSIDVNFIFASACLLESLGDKELFSSGNILQIADVVRRVVLASCCSCYVFSQQLVYFFLVKRVKCFETRRDEVEGNIRTLGKTKLTGFPRYLTLSVLLYFQTFTSTYFNSNKRIRFSGANQNSRLGTYKNTNLILKTTE